MAIKGLEIGDLGYEIPESFSEQHCLILTKTKLSYNSQNIHWPKRLQIQQGIMIDLQL